MLFCVVVVVLLLCCFVVVLCVVVLLCCVVCCVVCPTPKDQTLNLAWESGPALRGPTCSGFGVVVVVVVVVVAGLDFPGPPSAGPPLHWTPLRRTAQNFALFLPFPATVSLFLCLSGCLLVEFWWCFEGRNPEMCTFGLSGCRVKPRRPHQTGPPGLAHDSPRTPNVHISGHLRFKTPPKFHEKTPRETQKQRNGGGKGKKKREILGPPPFGAPPRGPTLRGPTLRGPHPSGPHPLLGGPHPSGPHFFWVWAPHPSGLHPSGPHPSGLHPSGVGFFHWGFFFGIIWVC